MGRETDKKEPKLSAWFRCGEGCPVRLELTEVAYNCPKCGGLLEVAHDVSALQEYTPNHWRRVFDERYMRTAWPYGSGVWGKKEWVCPEVADANIISMFEGGSNLFWASRFGTAIGLPDLWIKQCGLSHTGSFKDLGMTVLVSMVNEMRARGIRIDAVACASTGDTSAALAAYCAAAGIPAVVLLPKAKISPAQLVQPIANGALVLSLDTDFDGCMAIVKEITKEKTIYLANSMNSLRIEGQKTVAFEIVQQFDWEIPDWIVIPGGNLGNVSALGAGFQMMLDLGIISRMPRIVCAQAERANPLYESYLTGYKEFKPKPAEPTLASAIQIGNPVSIRRAIRTLEKFGGVVEQASESELADACARADRTGLFNCPHTGVAIAALLKCLNKGIIKRDERVVVISTASGLKFAEFKIGYHAEKLPGVKGQYTNKPLELKSDATAVMDAIQKFRTEFTKV